MNKLTDFIFNKIIHALPAVEDKRAAFYRLQVLILMRVLLKAGIKRILATPEEIEQLLQLGTRLEHKVDEQLVIVKPSTYKNWLRRSQNGESIKRPGRKRSISERIVQLVLRLIKENPGWGVLRVVGELRKLNVTIASSTVYRICRRNNIQPPSKQSKRYPLSTWSKFVKANMQTMVSCDFLTKQVCTLKGNFQAYCLVFIHYASRRAYMSPATFNPDETWLLQQARNVAMWLEDEQISLRFFIHDHDKIFTKRFDHFFQEIIKRNDLADKSPGRVILTAVRCPPQNGYVESFIGHFKAECLNHFVCFSLAHPH